MKKRKRRLSEPKLSRVQARSERTRVDKGGKNGRLDSSQGGKCGQRKVEREFRLSIERAKQQQCRLLSDESLAENGEVGCRRVMEGGWEGEEKMEKMSVRR